MNSAKACPDMVSGDLTQFELSKVTLRNLSKFNLKPTAKLVLMSLVDHYPMIYPSQQTIANELGISLRSVKTAVKELSDQGIIIYQTKGFNTYKLTRAFFGVLCVDPNQKIYGNKSTTKKMQNKNGGRKHIKPHDCVVQKKVVSSAEFAPKEINKEKTRKVNFKSIYTANTKSFMKDNVKPFSSKRKNYHSNIHIEGPQYQKYKPEKIKASSPMDMTKEQAIEFIGHMPPEVRQISTIAKQLKQKWSLA